MAYDVTVTTQSSDLNIRSGAGTSFGTVGSLTKGTVVNVDNMDTIAGTIWYGLTDGRGWVCGDYVTKVAGTDNPPLSTPQTSPTAPPTSLFTATPTGSSSGIDAKILEMLYASSTRYTVKIDASTRLFGCPFQFTKETDFRLNTTLDLGRKYLENIVAESPIMYFVPGRPNYLPDVSDNDRSALTSFFTSENADNPDDQTALQKILENKKEIRYFDFITDYAEYMRYVNVLCRVCALYLQIGDLPGPGGVGVYKYYDWSNYKYKNDFQPDSKASQSIFNVNTLETDIYDLMFGRYKYIQFYVEPNASFSESSNNNTNKSKMEGMFDSAEGIIKELSFLTNTADLKNIDVAKQSFSNSMSDISQKMLNNSGDGFFSRLLGMSSTVLTGSNILFPEIWGDSAYNKSYSVSMNLVSPYGDKESIYLNILVPLMHILALSLPRQTTANSYSSPFLVKAFAKGWFSCELGIIDSISIDKGGDGAWTVDGLPSEVKVQLSIKDLYSNLMVTPTSKPELFFQNQGLLEFLAVSCGIDLTKPNFMIKLDTMFSVFLGTAIDLPGNLYKEFIQNLRNQIEPLFKF